MGFIYMQSRTEYTGSRINVTSRKDEFIDLLSIVILEQF